VTAGEPRRDEVHEMAAAIGRLQPAQKEVLFRLLAERGDLPGSESPPTLSQGKLNLSAAQGNGSPDYVLTFDGGSRGNPGQGYGSYVIARVQDGAQRLERVDLGDQYTSNEAEYDTLIVALQDLLSRIEQAGRQPQEFALQVRGDSALVLNQVQGKWKAKEPRMRERRDRCLRLLRRFGTLELKLQPREESVRVLGH
jgi:ribonuclease HI